MESTVHAAVPLRVGKKMRKRRELDALVGGGGGRGGGRLLSASSDEGEPWARRASRRRRSRPFVRLAAALALCVCVVSAATVLWLFVDVRRQIVSLRVEMDRVSTSSDSVGDALQVCHTAAKELRANASDLSARLAKLEHDHQELAKRVEQAMGELAAVSGQLSAAPELREIPNRLNNLQKTVGEFGSLINGFDSSINTARKQAVTAAAGVEEVKTSLHQLEARTNETVSNVTANVRLDEELRQQLVAVNSTIGARVDALSARIEEITKPASTAAPSSSTAAPTSAAPPTTPGSTTTTTAPPGPPAKPSVLQ